MRTPGAVITGALKDQRLIPGLAGHPRTPTDEDMTIISRACDVFCDKHRILRGRMLLLDGFAKRTGRPRQHRAQNDFEGETSV